MFLPSYKAETQSGLSPSIWGNLPVEEWRVGRNGLFFMDDFVNPGKASASGATTNGGYGAYTTATSTTIQPSAPTNTGDNYGVMLYYISLAKQRAQLEAAGLAPGARVFDLKGRPVNSDTMFDSMAVVARKP